jgi:DnaJ-class molecular chaperone
MKTKDQKPQAATRGKCRACGGRGKVKQTKGGKTVSVKCISCRGTGSGGGYQTK